MPSTAPLVLHTSFGTGNYVVLVVYVVAMLVMGILAGRQTKGSAGYFLAESKVHFVLVGLSLLGTYLSPLTMMGAPSIAYGKLNWAYTVQFPFLLITGLVITRVVLPRYRKEGCLSVYEFLERRIGLTARLIASVSFILLSIGRKGLILYLPSLAFAICTGTTPEDLKWKLPLIITALGVVVTIYTVLGGIKGVIWTDATQVVILVGGALATLWYILHPGPGVDFMAIATQYGKFKVLNWSTDLTKIVTVWLVLETLVQTIRIYGTQQDMTQRYMAAESTRKANWGVWLSILGYIPLAYLFYFIGTGLFVFFHAHPDPNVAALEQNGRLDSLYAYFVVKHMPQGLAGLVIAAFFATCMSSISSNMNANSAVCVEDFYKRFWGTHKSDDHYLLVAKSMAAVWGVATIVMAMLFMHIELAQIVWNKVMGVTTCGVVGLMALAFLPRRINARAATIGFICSCVSLLLMMFFVQLDGGFHFVWAFPLGVAKDTGINFLLWPVVTNLVCFVVALGLDALAPRQEKLAETAPA